MSKYLDDTGHFSEVDSSGTTVTSEQITDATAVGKSLIKAADAGAARSAIGAGTPYTLPAATASVKGGVNQGAAVTNVGSQTVSGADAAAVATSATSAVNAVATKVNDLLAQLRASGIIAP